MANAESRSVPQLTTGHLLLLQERLGVSLSDPELLRQAVTHRSYLGESSGCESNERLEFLGDAVLGLVMAEHLYSTMTGQPEGELSKAKAVAVSEPSLAAAARDLRIQETLLLSTGEHISGGRERNSILSDTYEAIVAVVYLDQGLEVARTFILRSLAGVVQEIANGNHLKDYKSQLQQLFQSRRKITPRYHVLSEEGADHDKTFIMQVELDGVPLGIGVGKNKKQAEQIAAKQALENPKLDELLNARVAG